MKSTLATSFCFLGLALALPAPSAQSDDPGRVLPSNWKFEITSLKGPGCPDFNKPPSDDRTTRLTYGQNTMDGSEIYYWFVAYPYLRVELGKTDSTWCETELQYTELKTIEDKPEAADYRLRLHKNGTKVSSNMGGCSCEAETY